jgi:uncharacterized SAM-binding protein YcdF (DUF218 family)
LTSVLRLFPAETVITCSDILVLGKELRTDPERALRELKARAAAASAIYRARAGHLSRILALEACEPSRLSGALLVKELLLELEVPAARLLIAPSTWSTRAEAQTACTLAAGPLLALTTSYHVPRARRIFAESGPPQSIVHAPEGFYRLANAKEAQWMLEGIPDAKVLKEESSRETLFSSLEALVSPFPILLKTRLEILAAKQLRATNV